LKSKLEQETAFQDLLANKELCDALASISKKVEDISKNSTLIVAGIDKTNEILQKQSPKEFNLKDYVSGYKKKLINNIKTVNFLGLGIDPSIQKGKRKELASIFVKPTFQINSKYHLEIEERGNKNSPCFIEEKDKVSFCNLFNRGYNYIILGNPGAGKSLLLEAIMLYISGKSKEFSSEDILSYIPFYIELKKYIAFKKRGDKGCNLLEYLVHSLDYSSGIIEDNLLEILKKEKAILFFDGFDEIFNVNDKISVKHDIENFHTDFPTVRSITTSRFTGYNEAKFDEKEWCEMSILPFNNEQIIEYVQKWYQLEEEDAEKRDSEISDFISKMYNIDNDLMSNPLLLSLIVILYRNNLKIPESKFEIYQSCTNTLVDKWDVHRQINIEIENAILQKKESIFSDLAFWQYKTLSSPNPDITYHKAKSTVADSLVKKKLADDDNKDSLAASFLEYAQKRSIYFDNNFTHKTFLEYYTAYWIYSNIEKKHKTEERNKIIKQYIENPFWYVVLELLLNFIDKDQPDPEILDGIIEDNSNDIASLSFLLQASPYALPSLKNISERAQILVYTRTIEHILFLKANEGKMADGKEQVRYNLFSKIQQNTVNPKQKEIINKAINNFQNKNLAFYIFMEELCYYDDFKFDFDEIRNTSEYQETLRKNSYLFLLSYSKTMNYIQILIKYIKLFGIGSVFEGHNAWFTNSGFKGISAIFHYFVNQMSSHNIKNLYGNLKILEKNSLPKIQLLEYLLTYPYLGTNYETMQYLRDTIGKINDETEKIIGLVLLINSSNDIDNFNTARQIRNMKKNEMIKEFIKEFEISDKAILDLCNSL